jgi:hypothetical protein
LYLPGAIPLLDALFARYRIFDVIEDFEVNQPVNAIFLRKSFDCPRSMLIDTPH